MSVNARLGAVAVLGLFLAPVLLLMSAVGCSRPAAPPVRTRIAITQIVTHPGIDAVRLGFEAEMARLGHREGDTVEYDRTNANGDFPTAQAICNKIAASKPALLFSISTPSSQACAEALRSTSTPMVFGSITDPVAAGLVTSLDKPGGLITGTSDVWPVEDQFRLLQQLVPRAKTLGVIHNPAESNSQASLRLVDAAAAKLGFKVLKVPVAGSAEVGPAARSLVGRCDAIYVPADNTVISGLAAIVAVSERNKIPMMPGDTSNVEVGGFGTIGHDYSSIGAESARIADRILKGVKPGDIPVATSTVHQYYFNLKSARVTGVLIPEDLLKKAAMVYGR
jgi:putative tryptophan/tyrosine transport system substrate-binding protein